jgi:hypothetical protein
MGTRETVGPTGRRTSFIRLTGPPRRSAPPFPRDGPAVVENWAQANLHLSSTSSPHYLRPVSPLHFRRGTSAVRDPSATASGLLLFTPVGGRRSGGRKTEWSRFWPMGVGRDPYLPCKTAAATALGPLCRPCPSIASARRTGISASHPGRRARRHWQDFAVIGVGGGH